MVTKLKAAMAKLFVIGCSPNTLIDCSEVTPVPSIVKSQVAVLPAGKAQAPVVGGADGSIMVAFIKIGTNFRTRSRESLSPSAALS
ncbi:hypothetical protein BC835DRAFT_1411801 [Cytidiella melzeri]|nr:hypothetical protein BC835DRAFT_1411801 [Cytidiella melzeri]